MVSFWSERTYNISRCGLWKGMAEVHCHLLPGVDDGVKTPDEALQLLRYMEQQVGVRDVRFTPHTMMDFNNAPSASLVDKFSGFVQHYSGGIHLSLASEYMLDFDFCQRLFSQDVLPLGRRGKEELLLIETSCVMPPPALDDIMEDIAEAGYVPVMAHPERYVYMNEWRYVELAERGCLLQLNIPSLHGHYGEKVKKRAEWLLDKKMYHFAGFDIHHYESYTKVVEGLSLTRKRLEGLCELLNNNKSILD